MSGGATPRGVERRHRGDESPLLAAARAWVTDVHPHARHLLRTEDWLLVLSPGAREPLRLAAVLHDIERAFPDETATWDSSRDWNSPEYNRWHQDRCAEIASRWLRDNEGPVDEVADLIRVHEVGGWPAADLLQAADSLSFLETMVPLVLTWPRASAVGKLDDAVARMSVGREHALPLREAAGTLLNARLLRNGRMYRLALDRFPKMPLFPGHPTFEVVSYRTPQGIRAAGDEPWGPPNDACLGYLSELVMGTTHTGAHIDAHAHMTIGDEDRWHGGSARTDLGDFGPLKGDATEIPPLWRRGVLYDVPGHRGVPALPAGEPVTAEELLAIERETEVAVGPSDVALVRTGYLSAWPDGDLAALRGAGPDLSAAQLFVERGVFAVGSDTETFEVQPAPDRGEPSNPQPVHTLLLIEQGIFIMESLFLEELAAAGVREFLFVALPLKIRGATGSMIDPVAVT